MLIGKQAYEKAFDHIKPVLKLIRVLAKVTYRGKKYYQFEVRIPSPIVHKQFGYCLEGEGWEVVAVPYGKDGILLMKKPAPDEDGESR